MLFSLAVLKIKIIHMSFVEKGPILPKTFLQLSLEMGTKITFVTKSQLGIEFVIDSRSLKCPNVRSDDLGVWVNNGVRHCIVTCTTSGHVVSNVKVLPNKLYLLLKYFRLVRLLLSQAFQRL